MRECEEVKYYLKRSWIEPQDKMPACYFYELYEFDRGSEKPFAAMAVRDVDDITAALNEAYLILTSLMPAGAEFYYELEGDVINSRRNL